MVEVTEVGDEIFLMKLNLSEVRTMDVPELKEKMQKLILDKGIKKMVLDLSGVKTITSSGIGIFLSINQSLKSGFRIAGPSAEVKKVLELTKLTSVIDIFETIDIAVKSFN